MKDNEQIIDELGHCDKSYAYTLRDDGDKVTVGNHESSAYRIVYNDPELGEGGLACFYSVIENTYVSYDSVVFYSRVRNSRITDGSFIQNMREDKGYEKFGLDNCVVESSRVIDNTGLGIGWLKSSVIKNSNLINYSGNRVEFNNSTAVFESSDIMDRVESSTIKDSFVISQFDNVLKDHTLYENYTHSSYANREEALKKFNLS